MARAKSSVLSPDDKKAVVKDLKAKIKEAQTAIKGLEKSQLAFDKAYNKESSTRAKMLAKLYAHVDKLNTQLEAVSAAV